VSDETTTTATTPTPTRSRWVRLVMVGIVLPLLAASVLVWSTTDREQNLDRVPVAVVNNDTIIQKPQPMAAGRALAAALTQPSSDQTNLDWTLADTKDAKQGLRSGAYYAVLTIPPDFSKAILSSGSDDPFQGKVQLESNGAASTTIPYISESIAAAAASSLGNQTTQGYLSNVYAGFNQIASSNQKAASSAEQLATGTDQVSQGATQLDAGADSLAAGLGQLSSGAGELLTGTDSVRRGADNLAAGASGLARGARDLSSGARDLAGKAGTLARKDTSFARSAQEVARGASKASLAVHRLSLGTKLVTLNLFVLDRICVDSGASQAFCDRVTRARDRALRLAEGSVAVDKAVGAVARADRRLAVGANELAVGSRRLAAGARSLATATGEVSSGANEVSSGAASLARGATEVDNAAGQLATGAASSAAAGDDLASGSASVSSGAASTDQGAQSLSQGLAKGASESPTYTKKQEKALEVAVSQPVLLNHAVQHTSHGNGWLVALVMGVVLWVAALLGTLSRDLANVLRNAGAPIPSRRLAAVQLRPAAGLAVLQAVAVMAALPLLQVSTAAPVQLALLTVLAAATFTLLGVALRWAMGGAGIVVFVLLMALQAAALGNVVPLETAPAVLRTLNGILPLTAYVNGASQLVSGGHVGSLTGVVTLLFAWSLGASLAAVLVVRRRRVVALPAAAQA